MELEVDISAGHLIDWLRAELARGARARVAVDASREFVDEPNDGPVAAGDEYGDLTAMTTSGLLVVKPAKGNGAWQLTLRIDDPIGAHLPEDGSVPEEPEALSLEAFVEAFTSIDDGNAAVSVEAPTPADRLKFDRLLAEILEDRHGRRR